ncbi:MAG: hypothetical protein ACON4H_16370 [Rubripirellula sp.]
MMTISRQQMVSRHRMRIIDVKHEGGGHESAVAVSSVDDMQEPRR